jgi:hypothetical protein
VERDPRKDPRPGDVTKEKSMFGESIIRVTNRDGDIVSFIVGTGRGMDMSLSWWIETSESDEVLHVAGA